MKQEEPDCWVLRFEPRGRYYRALLRYLFRFGCLFTLDVKEELSETALAVLRELERFREVVGPSAEWPISPTTRSYWPEPEALDVLLQRADRLYAWKSPNLPENLFFRYDDGTALLMSDVAYRRAEMWLTDEQAEALDHDLPRFIFKWSVLEDMRPDLEGEEGAEWADEEYERQMTRYPEPTDN